MVDNSEQHFTLEMTVVSARGLKNPSSFLFSHRLRPFITITTFPPQTSLNAAASKNRHGFQTRVDDQGSAGLVPDSGRRLRAAACGISQATKLPAEGSRWYEDSRGCQRCGEVGRSYSLWRHLSDRDWYTGKGCAARQGDGVHL
ncbi:hypothetical protein HRI_004152200 [Hibiscus trionum]|uniref:Uncharacterized protein n=1 Tax=Hibiscus trionum TaxID=183268 RepID=A0A9W7IZP2_HIBTR|nr:hypothetical protein HRI_004152200 [Hibiscus trionum]